MHPCAIPLQIPGHPTVAKEAAESQRTSSHGHHHYHDLDMKVRPIDERGSHFINKGRTLYHTGAYQHRLLLSKWVIL